MEKMKIILIERVANGFKVDTSPLTELLGAAKRGDIMVAETPEKLVDLIGEWAGVGKVADFAEVPARSPDTAEMAPNDSPRFAFHMHDPVVIKESGESGTVIGQARHAFADDSFLIRYRSGDGRAVESWWTQTALMPRNP